ncbi:MAG: type II toxin-antitoxin system VapC family toxin, partial [Firmicutes bacterium]|nr:type II toxin-antitoxin system VapC family toxin [Bacillota bacterium]
MRFWDSSGLVRLLADQPGSQQARQLYREDPAMGVWWGTAVECWSALTRLRRDEVLSPEAEGEAGRLLAELLQGAFEVQPSEELRRLAIRLLRVHALR